MWISKAVEAMLATGNEQLREAERVLSAVRGENTRLKAENERLRSDMDWFKHRLSQVERERGQLIQAAIGVKIAVPEFVPAMDDPAEALNRMPDLSTIGEDAHTDTTAQTDADPGEGIDYSMMPGYKGR